MPEIPPSYWPQADSFSPTQQDRDRVKRLVDEAVAAAERYQPRAKRSSSLQWGEDNRSSSSSSGSRSIRPGSAAYYKLMQNVPQRGPRDVVEEEEEEPHVFMPPADAVAAYQPQDVRSLYRYTDAELENIASPVTPTSRAKESPVAPPVAHARFADEPPRRVRVKQTIRMPVQQRREVEALGGESQTLNELVYQSQQPRVMRSQVQPATPAYTFDNEDDN